MSAKEPIELKYDYSSLDQTTRDLVEQHARYIKLSIQETVWETFEIGCKLIEVKEKLPHGHFGPWIKAEFGWGKTTASKFMKVHSQLKFSDYENLGFSRSALYLIAEDSTPEEAREEILQLAKTEFIKHKIAKDIIKRYKPDTNELNDVEKFKKWIAAAPQVTKENFDALTWSKIEKEEYAAKLETIAQGLRQKPEQSTSIAQTSLVTKSNQDRESVGVKV